MQSNKLEDHIDAPIKRAVALMNLYGIGTIFSCCGFGYKGEVVPKSHISGRPQILFKATTRNMAKALKLIHTDLFASNNAWPITIIPTREREPFTKAMIGCSLRGTIQSWDDPASPHFHEGCNAVIASLEDRLLQLKDEMKSHVWVKDYNAVMKEAYPHWQYDPCDPWLVKKEDFV